MPDPCFACIAVSQSLYERLARLADERSIKIPKLIKGAITGNVGKGDAWREDLNSSRWGYPA